MSSNSYFIVGGSSGIGLAVTQTLAERGHEVYVGSRTQGDIPQKKNIHYFPFDVLAGDIPADQMPPSLNGLVYCPGTINLRPFRALKEDDFLTDFSINLLGAVRAIKGTLNQLKKAEESPSIVLFSTVAVQTGMSYHASIASAKGAVEGLIRSLAAEFAPKIRVNGIAPSITNTPLAGRLLSSDELKKASADRHPLQRYGEPQEIASLTCWLLEPDSKWVTGQILHVDGGISSVRVFK